MEPISNDSNTILTGCVNRINIDKMWEKTADAMGIQWRDTSYDVVLDLISNSSKPRIYNAQDPKIDFPWSFGDLCDQIKKNMEEITCRKIDEQTAIVLEELLLATTYIPYGKISIKSSESEMMKNEGRALLREINKGARKYCFAKTRAANTMTRITKDFVAGIQGKDVKFGGKSFTFRKFPFKYPKGFEGRELWRVYKEFVRVEDMDEFYSRAVLDFMISLLLWCNLKYSSIKELVVSSSLLCFTTLVDYVGEYDDAGCGESKAYADAIYQGLALYNSPILSAIAEDSIATSSLIALKRDVHNVLRNLQDVQPSAAPVPTPSEYMEMRWWDAACPGCVKILLALSSVQKHTIPLDTSGSPEGTRKCAAVRGAVALMIRYNEIVDIIHDVGGEPFNEVHVASKYAGE